MLKKWTVFIESACSCQYTVSGMDPGHGSAILVGLGYGSDPVYDPVLSFNMHVCRGVVSTE